jgi:hypothetical protein
MRRATDYDIIRNAPSDPRIRIPCARKPIAVMTLMNESRFTELNGGLLHGDSVLIEDEVHDWNWDNGNLRYYSRMVHVANIVAVYAEDNVARTDFAFCPHCGVKQHSVATECHACKTSFTQGL